jgi:putative DNA primase/helicase
VLTGYINTDALIRDRDQLWAEAALLETAGASLTLPKQLWDSARAEQEQRQEQDPWDDILVGAKGEVCPTSDGEGKEERIASDTLLRKNLDLEASRIGDWEAKRLSYCMRRLGWEGPKKMRINGQSVNGYRRKSIQ